MRTINALAGLLVVLIACDRVPSNDAKGTAAQEPKVAANDSLPQNGPAEVKGPDGRVKMKGSMRNGKRHGVWTSYHPGGATQSKADYVDGVQQGASVVYHPNGQVYYIGDYLNGVQVGEWRFFDEGGTLVRTLHYDSTGTVINDR